MAYYRHVNRDVNNTFYMKVELNEAGTQYTVTSLCVNDLTGELTTTISEILVEYINETIFKYPITEQEWLIAHGIL